MAFTIKVNGTARTNLGYDGTPIKGMPASTTLPGLAGGAMQDILTAYWNMDTRVEKVQRSIARALKY